MIRELKATYTRVYSTASSGNIATATARMPAFRIMDPMPSGIRNSFRRITERISVPPVEPYERRTIATPAPDEAAATTALSILSAISIRIVITYSIAE